MRESGIRRVYGSIPGRQQGADRLVYDEGDFRRVLAEAARTGETATIRLGSDIYLSTPITIPATTFDLVIEGADRFGFRCAAGFSAAEMFRVGPGADNMLSGILWRGLIFEAPAVKLGRLMACVGLAFSVSFRDCTFERIERIVQPFSGSIGWRDAEFSNLHFIGLTISDTTDIGTADFDRCLFLRCYAFGFVGSPSTVRQVGVNSISGSSSMVAIDAGPPALGGSLYLTSGLGQSQINRLSVAGELIVGGDATVAGAVTISPTTPATLNAANPILDPAGASFVRYSVGAAGTGNIFVASGVDGQIVVLWCASYAGTAIFSDSTANSNCRLVGNFTPTARSTLTLIFEASDDAWQEIARANT